MKVRVLICHSIRLYAEGLLRILEEHPEGLVARLLDENDPSHGNGGINADVVIADEASFPGLAGRANHILLIRNAPDHQGPPPFGNLKEMVEQGLAGMLEADTSPELLRKAVFKVHEGELWMDHAVIRDFLMSGAESPAEVQLSKREREIMQLICEGHTNREIAERLFISEPTVKSHCNHLFKKFGVSSRLQLALTAVGDDPPLCTPPDNTERNQPGSAEH